MGAHGSRDRHHLTARQAVLATSVAALTGAVIGLTQYGPWAGNSRDLNDRATSVQLPAATLTLSPPTSTPSPTTSPTRPPTTKPAKPAKPAKPIFSWRVARVTAAELGKSWHRGCPVGPRSLRSVSIRFWGFDGRSHTGVLILHRDVVAATRPVFAAMFERRFPLHQLRPVSEFKANDDASMAADNSSAFNCRRAVAPGPPTWSRHAFGKAIDVNPVENPFLYAGKVRPPDGKAFTDRSTAERGLIQHGDRIYRAFIRAGFHWGGKFSDPDYQHFDR